MEDRRNVGENSCNSGDGNDQRVQSLMFMMMMMIKKILNIKFHENPSAGKPSRSTWQVMMKLTVALRNIADDHKNETHHYDLERTPSFLRRIIIFQHNPSEITILMRKRKWLFVNSCEYERPISTAT